MKRTVLFLMLVVVFGLRAQAEASPSNVNLYASPDGTGDGFSADFPTDIQSVKSLARLYNVVDNVTIYLRGGTYDMITAGPLLFTSADSGQNGYQVVWRAYPGDAPPILSGGVRVTGWALHDAAKNIWRAPVPAGYKARQFWVNGQRAERTRWVSESFFRTTRTQSSPYWKEALDDPDFPDLSFPADVELVQRADSVPFMADWRHLIWGVTSVSRVGDVTTFSIPQAIKTIDDDWMYNDNMFLGSVFSSVENAYDFLASTAKGQWFLPSSENFIYYVPRDGEEMTTAECWLPHSEVLLMSSSGLANVTFLGISFRYTGWLKPTTQKSFIEVQANNYLDSGSGYRHWNQSTNPVGPFPQAAVEIYAADNIKFIQCEFTHLGGTGLYLGLGCQDSSVSGNLFADISSNALNIGSIVWPDADDGSSGNPPAVKTENILVQSNHIYDVASQYNGGVGIFLGYTENVKVLDNHIHDVPYTGISVGWGWTWMTEDWYLNPSWGLGIRDYSGGNEVAFNSINDTMQVLFDGGAVYSLAEQPGSTIHDNYITNCGSSNPQYGLNPIYYDEGSRYGEAYNNIILKNIANGPMFAIDANVDLSRGDLSAHNNYFTTPYFLYWYGEYPVPGGGTLGNTTGNTRLITDDPSEWPTAAQTIAAAAGLDLVLHSDIVEGSAIIFGWKYVDTVLSIDPDNYYSVSDYEEFDTGMWRANVSGITDNLAALVVSMDTAPVITGPLVTELDPDRAVIEWTTNVASSTTVNYGTSSGVLDQSRSVAGSDIDHQVTLTGLFPATTYYYRVLSTDGSGHTATSDEATFTTTSSPPPIAAPASMCVPTSSATGSFEVAWTPSATADPAETYVVEEYSDANFTTLTHSYTNAVSPLAISGKTTGTWYYRVKAVNAPNPDSDWTLGANGCQILYGIATTTLTNGQVGADYHDGAGLQLTAIGGTAPYTWSAFGLPDGLTLSADGLISGIPTASNVRSGSAYATFPVSLYNVDSAGSYTARAMFLTVYP
ncbi:MAG TPA: fibronectin type III domain-containing protein [Geothermobacteraceae bacterium]|nr:fibronectin type III domain-containing protein [Geothermobacteraceae bacterium]